MLHLLMLAAGLAITAGIYALSPALSLWWVVPLAAASYLAAVLLTVLMLVIVYAFPVKKTHYYDQATYTVMRLLLPFLLSLLGIRIQVEGSQPLPAEPFLLVSNHRSNWDPLVTMAAFNRRKISFVSKPENFKLPIAGGWMKRAGFLAIDRENPRKAIAAIHEAANLITEHGLSVGLYPEGTRNKSEELLPLLPFHNGSMKIAKLAKCPLAVITVRYEKGALWHRIARLRVVDILPADTVTATRTEGLAETARTAIENDLKQE